MSNITVIVRCIENMMGANQSAEYYSNSQKKSLYIPHFIGPDQPDFVISVSTAESTPDIVPDGTDSINGSVIMGGNFFMFDARNYNPTQPSPSKLDVANFQKNTLKSNFYNLVNGEFSAVCCHKFVPQKTGRAQKLYCMANPDYTSIGVVNIVEYGGYKKGDPAAYNEFVKQWGNSNYKPASIETTHGIVKMCVDKTFPQNNIPTLFVSPITDRYEHFTEDVDDVQNYIAAFNAGIAVGELLVALNENPSLI